MSSTTLYLTGKVYWAHRLFEPDDFAGVRKWKVDFYPDTESLEKLRKSGSRKNIKTNEHGTYVSLDRPVSKDFGKGPQDLTPPEVLNEEGNKWADGVAIGNGSSATVKVVVYDTRIGKGTRLEAVRIDELVHYNAPEVVDTDGASPPDGIPF